LTVPTNCERVAKKEDSMLPPHGAYHPINMRCGLETWCNLFDSIVLSDDSHEKLAITEENTEEEGAFDDGVSTDNE
jgi:hypothetical protein